MKERTLLAVAVAAAGLMLAGAPAQAGTPQFDKIMKRAQQMRSLIITEADEIRIGEAVSEKVRVRYGVVQDPAVHRYVTLVGLALAGETNRPGLPWKFIVLDTDGVNAFAAPGGFIHITRGALGLMSSEAELAGVLAHEIEHVTQKHTVDALQKSKASEIAASESGLKDSKVFSRVVDASTEMVLSGFGRNEELESDREGVRLANKVGYSPRGLSEFLGRLLERNKSATAKQGLFASHPEMRERLDKLAAQVTGEKLASTATLEDRYHKNISYQAKAQVEIAGVAAGSSGLAPGTAKKDDKPAEGAQAKEEEKPKQKGFGLSSLLKPAASDKKSAEVTGSGASRGVDTERNAKGGAVSTLVSVSVKPADVAAFKKEGNLK
jgi:beta-barrel assembly-enhancing protease